MKIELNNLEEIVVVNTYGMKFKITGLPTGILINSASEDKNELEISGSNIYATSVYPLTNRSVSKPVQCLVSIKKNVVVGSKMLRVCKQ